MKAVFLSLLLAAVTSGFLIYPTIERIRSRWQRLEAIFYDVPEKIYSFDHASRPKAVCVLFGCIKEAYTIKAHNLNPSQAKIIISRFKELRGYIIDASKIDEDLNKDGVVFIDRGPLTIKGGKNSLVVSMTDYY